ncbi:MAG: aldehyde reductase [Gammaproteobacteria bacterium]|nr:aldehyde reductase [Gammaproteobacteria bacterium]
MEKVFISGGSGYIALHCIAKLIERGFSVKTSLRNMDRKEEIIKSISKVVNCKNKIDFCELDLLKDQGWDEAVSGCDYVLHLASPVMFGVPKDSDTLIKPALGGVERCLKSAVKHQVKRFVMTSSFAAIGSGTNKIEFDDNDWTDLNNEIHAYNISKTKAEQFLWEHINSLKEAQKIEVCAINPVVVIGPSLSDDMGTSNLAIRKLLDGSMPFIPKFGIDLVDVQDVADMHIEAMLNKEAVGKRFLLSANTIWYSEVADILRKNGFKKAPKHVVPNIFIRIFSLFDKEAKLALDRLGKKYTLHPNNALNILNWKPRNIEKSIIETAHQLRDLKIIDC